MTEEEMIAAANGILAEILAEAADIVAESEMFISIDDAIGRAVINLTFHQANSTKH
jgi:multidrug efflux pump subunit AcrA (membrane-fusion protein)